VTGDCILLNFFRSSKLSVYSELANFICVSRNLMAFYVGHITLFRNCLSQDSQTHVVLMLQKHSCIGFGKNNCFRWAVRVAN